MLHKASNRSSCWCLTSLRTLLNLIEEWRWFLLGVAPPFIRPLSEAGRLAILYIYNSLLTRNQSWYWCSDTWLMDCLLLVKPRFVACVPTIRHAEFDIDVYRTFDPESLHDFKSWGLSWSSDYFGSWPSVKAEVSPLHCWYIDMRRVLYMSCWMASPGETSKRR
jgi:hypothetical protein